MKETGDIRIDEIMPHLCKKWPLSPFEACLQSVEGRYAKLKKNVIHQSGTIPVVDQGEDFIAGYVSDNSLKYTGPLPVVIFGDHTRRLKFVDFEFAVGADGTKLLHPIACIDARFFYHYLCALNLESQGYSRHYRFLKEVSVPLPPLNEQRRIVAKLEELLERVDTSQKRLARIPVILKRFRQAVLAAACSGRLTADWREERGIGEGEDLPEGWNATTLGKLTFLVTSGSRGWAQYYSDFGSVFIRAQNINSDFLDLSDIAYVTLPNRAEGLRTKVQKDDLLVTITGANVTKSARVLDDLNDAYVSQHVALVRLEDVQQSPYVFLCLISASHGRAQLFEAAYGQGKPGLNLGNIRDVAIPLPPLPEQHEIVRRVESFFTLADQLEARYKKAKSHVDKLTQSILAKAFRGELVPQDPNDEPASALLERIRARRPCDTPPKRRKKG